MAEEMNLSDFSVGGKSLEDGATPVETPLNDNVETEAPEQVTEEVQVEETPVAESEPVEATTEESFDDAADIAQAEIAEETYTPTEAPDAFNEFINSTTDGAFETYAEMEQALLDMATQLEQLSEKQREVLARRFGLRGHEKATLEEVGRQIGLTRERVRQIQVEALRALRELMEKEGLSSDMIFEE